MNTRGIDQADGSGFLEQLNGAVRENPVSAAVIGLGVLWMFLGKTTISSLASPLSGSASTVVDGVRRASESAGAAATEASHNVADAAKTAGDSVKAGVSAVIDAFPSNPAPVIADKALEYSRGLGQSVQKNVAGTLEGQPLLLGAIGIGIGLGLASVFSSTKFEQDLVGNAAADLKDRFSDLTQEVEKRAEKVLDVVKHEMAGEGITTASLKEGVGSLVEKVISTADAVTDSVRDRSSLNAVKDVAAIPPSQAVVLADGESDPD